MEEGLRRKLWRDNQHGIGVGAMASQQLQARHHFDPEVIVVVVEGMPQRQGGIHFADIATALQNLPQPAQTGNAVEVLHGGKALQHLGKRQGIVHHGTRLHDGVAEIRLNQAIAHAVQKLSCYGGLCWQISVGLAQHLGWHIVHPATLSFVNTG